MTFLGTTTTTTSSYGLDAVNVSTFKAPGGSGDNEKRGGKLLVVTPRWDDSLDFLKAWLQTNRSWVETMMLSYGAVLIRGFAVLQAADMEGAVKSFQPALNNTYRGTSPRNVLEGTEYVFSAAEVPSNYPIAQHIEMSFLPEPPKQLYFCCLKPSKSVGGETAVADFRKVYQDLPLELRRKFLDKGVRYTRTHKKKGTYYTYDVSDMLGWPELFGTDDKARVEEICRSENIPFEWRGPEGDETFVSVTQSDAFQLHPVTKEHVWFNHTQVFHWTTFPAELWLAFRRTREWRMLLQLFVVTVFCVVKYAILGHKVSLDATFGDGEPITVAEMSQIRSAIHKNMVFSRWEKGDILMIDNFSTSHGRQPTFDKGRKVAVAWADPIRKKDEVASLEPYELQVEPASAAADEVAMENPQERSPQSTLTRSDSAALQAGLASNELDAKLSEFLAAAAASAGNPQQQEFEQGSRGGGNDLGNLFRQQRKEAFHARSMSQPIFY